MQEKYKLWRLRRRGFIRKEAKHTSLHYKPGNSDIIEEKVGLKRKAADLNPKSKRERKDSNHKLESFVVIHSSTADIVIDVLITMPLEQQLIRPIFGSFYISFIART